MPPAQRSNRRAANANLFALFPVAVSRVQKLSPNFHRISLSGYSLVALSEQAGDSSNNLYDSYIKLLIPPPQSQSSVEIDLASNWRTEWFAQPAEERGWMRTYTIRARRLVDAAQVPPAAHQLPRALSLPADLVKEIETAQQIPEIDIDFVLHQDDGRPGPGTSWAEKAQVGDLISFIGPLRGSSENFSPLWTTWAGYKAQRLVIAVDETALPAASSIITSLRPDQEVDVLLEVPSSEDILTEEQALFAPYLKKLPNLRIHWLPRGAQKLPQARGEALYTALRQILSLEAPKNLPQIEEVGEEEYIWDPSEGDGDYYVFIAGESTVIKTLRRICINDAGLDKSNIAFMGYWKEGRAES